MSTVLSVPAARAGSQGKTGAQAGPAPGRAGGKSKERRPLPAASREAQQRAAAILEVLAGVRTPGAAAQALGVSLPRYYLLEERALHGLVQACHAPPRGRAANVEAQRARLGRECQRWQRECARQQALVRAAQRTIGLSTPPPAPAQAAGRKRRPRRPTARALKAVARLCTAAETTEGTTASTAAPTPS